MSEAFQHVVLGLSYVGAARDLLEKAAWHFNQADIGPLGGMVLEHLIAPVGGFLATVQEALERVMKSRDYGDSHE